MSGPLRIGISPIVGTKIIVVNPKPRVCGKILHKIMSGARKVGIVGHPRPVLRIGWTVAESRIGRAALCAEP